MYLGHKSAVLAVRSYDRHVHKRPLPDSRREGALRSNPLLVLSASRTPQLSEGRPSTTPSFWERDDQVSIGVLHSLE